MNDDERVIKSYVWHQGKCFFVSTIERDSSAIEGPRRYNETIVWEFDWPSQKRGKQIYQDGDGKHSIAVHLRTCQNLHDAGTPENEGSET